jgi:(R)-2-hydroxyacyl-CoA dehydratese activating ATPase
VEELTGIAITEARRILGGVSCDRIMATGYGRGLFETAFDDAQTVTEIKAHARGVVSVFPGATTILDIGGQYSKAIARGLHLSVVKRAAGMINRVSSLGDIVFSGGVANNPCIKDLISQKLGRQVLVPETPQMMGALGAALILAESAFEMPSRGLKI